MLTQFILPDDQRAAANNNAAGGKPQPTRAQLEWLRRGLDQPGGKLPLFDEDGQRVARRTVQACVQAGWAEPWFKNPLKPEWQVCRLTDAGRRMLVE